MINRPAKLAASPALYFLLLNIFMVYELFSEKFKVSDPHETGFFERRTRIGDENYNYQIYISPQVKKLQNPPVIIFLHGIRERGTKGVTAAFGAFRFVLEQYLSRIPAIIILPQCRPGKYWQDPLMDKMVTQALAETLAEFPADQSRISLLGISMGGFGAWHFASQYPIKFAALVAICGGSPLTGGDRFTRLAAQVKTTPAWLFHGAADEVVPVTESRQLVKALESLDAKVKYSEYQNVGHNVWLQAFSEKELLPWLLSQRKTF